MPVRLSLAGLFSVPLVLALAACAPGATPGPAATPTPGATEAAAVTCTDRGSDASVAIADFSFAPAQVTVSVGDIVQWTNSGRASHTVTFDDGPDCGTVASGATVSASFGQAGTYAYFCSFHSTMRGTITVGP